jgi:hypothetical protein
MSTIEIFNEFFISNLNFINKIFHAFVAHLLRLDFHGMMRHAPRRWKSAHKSSAPAQFIGGGQDIDRLARRQINGGRQAVRLDQDTDIG